MFKKNKKYPLDGKHLNIKDSVEENNSHIKEILDGSHLEKHSVLNHIHKIVMPPITSYVKKKKKKHLQKHGHDNLETNFWLFDGLKRVKIVRENVGKSGALHVIYNFWETVTFFDYISPASWLEAFWVSMLNCKSVRNRYKLIRSILTMSIYKMHHLKNGETIEILEVAAGSSQVLIKTIAFLKKRGIKINAKLIDIDEKSLETAKRLAEKLGISDSIETKVQNLFKYFSTEGDGKKYDIIEMVGIADYLTDEQKYFVYGESNKKLNAGGFLITANISDNPEREFIHTVADWPDMIYRSKEEMEIFIGGSGFNKNLVFTEPLGVYVVAVGEKD